MAESYKDPYKTLGVSRDATDEEIKKAYREMVKKYHPDNYANTPMAELAEEKMKEINEAYDLIKQMRQGKASDGARRAYGADFDARATYDTIRKKINENDVNGADALLEIFSRADRGAEWNFLKGCVYLRKGYFYDAQKYFETACYMDPGNEEYRSALNAIRSSSQRREGRANADSTTGGADSAVSCCETLLCANCCCNCLGGDFFRCC